jgi:hypothetical protein
MDNRQEENAQSRGDETDEIADDTTAEGEDDGIPGALLRQEEILDLCLALSALGGLAWGDYVCKESWSVVWIGERRCDVLSELVDEKLEIQGGEVSIGDEYIGGGGESSEEGM